MAKITFKYCTKKKAQYLEKVVKLRKQGRSISSILKEVPIGRTTLYLWINEVFNGGTYRKSPETSGQGEMKKEKPTANHKENGIQELVAAPDIANPATLEQCQVALKNNAELKEANEEAKEGTEDDASLSGLDEKALKKMVRKLRKEVKTQTVRGDLYKKMLQIASEDTGIDFLKKPGAGQ